MGKCTFTMKMCLLVISLVFWGAAAALCFISSWVYRTYHDFNHLTEATLTLVPASIILGVAIFMFLIGLIGCIAVCKESKILLSTYFCLILIVFLGEVVAGAMGYVYRYEVEKTVRSGMEKALDSYTNDTVMMEQIDFVQKELHCCGITDSGDWNKTTYYDTHNQTVPDSCCINQANLSICSHKVTGTDVYHEGCLSALEHKFTTNLVYIASVTISFAVIQILGLITTCILICRTREVKYDRLENAQRDGLRV